MSWFSDAVDEVGGYFGDSGTLSDQIDPTNWFSGGTSSPTTPSSSSNSSSFLSAVGAGVKEMSSQKNAENNVSYSLIHPVNPQVRGQVNPIDITPRQPPTNTKAAQTVDGMSVQNYWMSTMKSLANGAPK